MSGDTREKAVELVGTLCGIEPALARSVLAAAAPGPIQLATVFAYLGECPDALRSGSSAAPVSVIRLALALHRAGVEAVVPPRCADCGRSSTRLDYLVPGGRICIPCHSVRRADTCRVCGQHRLVATRNRAGHPICPACASKDPAHVRPCGQCGRSARVALRINGLVLGRCCAAPLAARCTVCGWRKGVRAYKTRRPLCAVCASGPRAICAGCGLDAPEPDQPGAPAVCARCARRAPAPCRDCGTLTPRRSRPGQPPQCQDCVTRPVGRCGRCGRNRVIVRRAIDGNPDLCGGCWQGPLATCARCGQQRACRGERRGVMLCQPCSPRRLHTCARCGRQRPSGAELGEGRLCTTCYDKALAAKARCPGCGTVRRLLTYSGHHAAICADCAGVPGCRVCRHCGTEDLLYTAGLCPACALRSRLTSLLGPPEHPHQPALEPIRGILQDASHARTVLDWLHRSPSARLLADIVAGELELSHAALDALPPSGPVRFIDDLLTAAGVLPARDPVLARLETSITRTLDAAALTPTDRRAVRTWLNWTVLPRRRRCGQLTEGSANAIKTCLRSVLALLEYFEQADSTLTDLDQATLDTWLAGNPERYPQTRPFLIWAVRRRLIPPLQLPAARASRRRPVLATDLDLARRLLHDPLPEPDLPDRAAQLRARIAGLLVLLYAQPLSRICRLTLESITIDGPTVRLHLGPTAITCPPQLAALITAHLAERRYLSAVQPSNDPGWLFPGRNPGRPFGSTTLAEHLRRIDVRTATARPAALQHLATSLPQTVVADLFSVNISTVNQIRRQSGISWARYAATRPPSPTISIRRPTNN